MTKTKPLSCQLGDVNTKCIQERFICTPKEANNCFAIWRHDAERGTKFFVCTISIRSVCFLLVGDKLECLDTLDITMYGNCSGHLRNNLPRAQHDLHMNTKNSHRLICIFFPVKQ